MKFIPSRLRHFAPLALVLVCAAIAVAAYLQALHAPFISDDEAHITTNSKLIGLHFVELWRLMVEPFNVFAEFLPLRELSLWFDIQLFGLNPAAFRLHNIALYLLGLPLMYATTVSLWRYFRPAEAASAPWVAAVVTALFAIHPALVESVVWIGGRKYILPNLFALLALWLTMQSRREHGFSAPHAAAALFAVVAMMLAKASYFPVAAIIALLWLLFWRDIPAPQRRRTLLLWPLAILLLAAVMVLIFIGHSTKGKMATYFGIEVITRALVVMGGLTRLAVSPENRHFVYPIFDDPWFPGMVALGALVLTAAMWGGIKLLRRRSLTGFALVAFVLLCLPYLQLIPVVMPSLVSDRYLSLAAWPVILLLVTLTWRLQPVPRIVLLIVIALPWVYQTIERPRDWRSYETLVDADWRAYPGHYLLAFQKIMGELHSGLYRDAGETANLIKNPEIRAIMIMTVQAIYAAYETAAQTGKPEEAMSKLWNLGLKLQQPPVETKWKIGRASCRERVLR